jgi:hypothetical protein
MTSSAAARREAAAVWRDAGHALFAQGEDLLAKAHACFAREREELEAAEDIDLAAEAEEHWGSQVRLVRKSS